MLDAALEQDLRWLAGRAGADADADVSELPSYDEVRTFRIGSNVLRIEGSPAGQALRAEELALRVLGSISPPSMAPTLTATGNDVLWGAPRSWLSYPYLDGTTLTRETASSHAAEIGRRLAAMHSLSVFDLRERLPFARSMTLMDANKEVQEQLRGWLDQRELDGLGPDLLTLALSDLQSVMRTYALEMDPHFWVSRRRVLCHGRLEPSRVVRDTQGQLRFVGFEHAYLGDPYEDLAHFSLAAQLSEDAEQTMLDAYQAALLGTGREDKRFTARFAARRMLGLLQRPTRRLHRLVRLKQQPMAAHVDWAARLRYEMRAAYEELVQALNGLRALLGNHREVTLREVESMGRLLVYEDLLLHQRRFWLAITGRPYSGKTELSVQVALRLQHTYLNVGALSRTLAWWMQQRGHPFLPSHVPAALDHLLSGMLQMTPHLEAPFYQVRCNGEDIGEALRDPTLRISGAKLLDDATVRAQISDALRHAFPNGGLVLEGIYADSLLPAGHHHFFIHRAPELRRAQLMGHRARLDDEHEAAAFLHHLDEATTPPPPDAVAIDLMRRPAIAGALDVMWHLIEPSERPSRPMADLSGRQPLFQK